MLYPGDFYSIVLQQERERERERDEVAQNLKLRT